MKNPHYSIQNNEGGGDCFFATIRDAFSTINQHTSVTKIRERLAKEVTSQVFVQYKEHYDMYSKTLTEETNQINALKQEYLILQQKAESSIIDRDMKNKLVSQGKLITNQVDNLLKERTITMELLNEYKYMKGINTLAELQQYIKKTKGFWADTWAISTLERIFNIKIIILSSEIYKNTKDKTKVNNVLTCGQLNDVVLQQMPDFYIIVDYTGNHYMTIGYKTKWIFKFSEVPYDIKQLVVDKCLENNAGPFGIIPDFANLKKK